MRDALPGPFDNGLARELGAGVAAVDEVHLSALLGNGRDAAVVLHTDRIRIGGAVGTEEGGEAGVEVDITVRENEIIVSRVSAPRYRLENLLAQVSKKNIHDEIDTGESIGREVW